MTTTALLWRRAKILLGALEAWPDIRRLLVRRHDAKRRRCRFAFDGVDVEFWTDDFYSNAWFWPLFESTVYEPGTLRVLLERLPAHRCLADVGANLGYFSILMAKAAPRGRVYAFEADVTLLPLIRRNADLNGLDNLVAVGASIGADGPTGDLVPHPFSFLSRVTGVPTGPFEVKITVPRVGLDDYFAAEPAPPDLVKIDVDGAEMDVLRSMPRTLAQPEVELLLEIHRQLLPGFGSSAEDVVGMLRDLGFRLYRIPRFREDASRRLTEIESPAEIQSPAGDMYLVTRRP